MDDLSAREGILGSGEMPSTSRLSAVTPGRANVPARRLAPRVRARRSTGLAPLLLLGFLAVGIGPRPSGSAAALAAPPSPAQAPAALAAPASPAVAPTAPAASEPVLNALGPAASSLRWGLLGNGGTHIDDVRAAGVTTRLFELDWSTYEPRNGVFDSGYVSWARGRLQALRTAGYSVILSLGVQHQPGWLLALPRSRYVNQFGNRYDDGCVGCARANLVFNAKLRALQARYIARAFADFGTDFAAVRLGGGRFGELGYPPARYKGHANVYWAFDANAARSNPVPGWRPGERSRHGQARRFLTWYLDALVAYERWQIRTIRGHFGGPLMLLMPSWGIRPNQATAAIKHDLRGSTSAEINGEIQRGYDFARQVRAVSDPGVILSTTWLDASGSRDGGSDQRYWSPVHYLAYLGSRHSPHLAIYGENTGHGSASTLRFTAAQARRYGLLGLAWFSEAELFSGRFASLGDYADVIAAN